MKHFSFPKDFSQKTYLSFLVVAFVCGIVTKSILNDVVTIGYEDYTLKNSSHTVDFNALQSEMIQKGKIAVLEKTDTPRGETCSQ